MRRAWSRAVAAAGLFTATLAWGALDPDRALESSRAAVGSIPRDFAFTDTEGRRVTLADYRGKPLVVSFVYTGCSQVCPTTTRFLSRAVREARAVVGPDAFRVISIGFNVPYDNPVSMKVFARRNGVDDDPRWAFLTPDADAPESLARDFGFAYAPQSGGFDHLTQVTLLDGAGRVYTQVYGETFELPMLVQPLRSLAMSEPAPAGVAAWVDRARLLCTVYDPVTGKYRLDYALFAELAAGILVLGFTLAFLIRERRRARRAC